MLIFLSCSLAIWLNPDKSLREQGVDENEVIVLKKKFFVTDSNIDRTDPIQLNLLYVQVGILDRILAIFFPSFFSF